MQDSSYLMDQIPLTMDDTMLHSEYQKYHDVQYPAWEYTGSSELADSYAEIANRLYGLNVTKTAIHAGLECGIVKEKAPEMEMITCGANARNIHSPAEELELASFERLFGILSHMLRNCE